jgi:hypothetical protein
VAGLRDASQGEFARISHSRRPLTRACAQANAPEGWVSAYFGTGERNEDLAFML